MTNSQRTVKLDLSSLLTETSAHSDNQYTSSALNLLLDDTLTDHYGGGIFFDKVKAVASSVAPTIKAAASSVAPTVKAAAVDAFRNATGNAVTPPRSVSPTRRNSPQRNAAPASVSPPRSPLRRFASQINAPPASVKPPQRNVPSVSVNPPRVIAPSPSDNAIPHPDAFSDTSPDDVNQRLNEIENKIDRIIELLTTK